MRIDNTLYYVLKDHLGSASVITNATPTPGATATQTPTNTTPAARMPVIPYREHLQQIPEAGETAE